MFNEIFKMDSMNKLLNDYTFTDYYYRLTLLANSVFEWEGLPNHISEKWLERYLYINGCCMFYKDPDLGFMVAKCSEADTLNAYDEPTKLLPVATNYIYKGEPMVCNKECVMIYNNDLRLPTYPTIRLYAYRIAEITRTSDINIQAQKTPCLVRGTDKSILSLKNVYKQWSGNEPVIYYDKNGIDSPIEVLKTEAPIVFDKLRDEKNQLWSECMTFLGINNANTDKRERLVDDEVQANNEQIQLSAEMFLKTRQEACKLINEIFGLNVSVKMRKFNTIENQTLTKEGVEE